MKNYPRFTYSEFVDEAELQVDSELVPSDESDSSDQEHQNSSQEIMGADSVVRTITVSDVEQAKKESYTEGYNLAKEESQKQIDELKEKYDLHEKLYTQLNSMSDDQEMLLKKVDVIRDIVQAITNSLILVMPTNFSELFEKKLLPYISKHLTGDKITIKLHPSNMTECEKLLKLSKLPKALRDNVEIVAEENFATGDCVVANDNTMFSYNRDKLIQEVADITSKFINNK